jgi:hypothetical protein
MKRMLAPRANLCLSSSERDHQVLERTFLYRFDLSALAATRHFTVASFISSPFLRQMPNASSSFP